MHSPIIRLLEEQVEPAYASRLRSVQTELTAARRPGRVSSYYIFEVCRAIDVGMLLSAMTVSTVLIEIWLRDMLASSLGDKKDISDRIERDWNIASIDASIEEDRRASGHKIIRELAKLDVVDKSEVDWLRQKYQPFRNTLLHGISGRLVGGSLSTSPNELNRSRESMFLDTLLCGPDSRLDEFENLLDRDACDYLEKVTEFIRNHPLSHHS